METIKVTRDELRKIITEDSKILTVSFVKKDGSERVLNGSAKMVHGKGGQNTTAHLPQYVKIEDLKIKEGPRTRNVNLDTIFQVKKAGKIYTVVHK